MAKHLLYFYAQVPEPHDILHADAAGELEPHQKFQPLNL